MCFLEIALDRKDTTHYSYKQKEEQELILQTKEHFEAKGRKTHSFISIYEIW
jgi:hypothetical protein